MVNRVLYSAESGKPIEFSQDFLRGDFARIHMDIDLN
jgi:DNA-binding GntR family transcriptional regulator